jgi:alpha-L-fucosidase
MFKIDFTIRLKIVSVCTCTLIGSLSAHQLETTEQRDARMSWWREARFGMFVHWGLYSIPAGEWEGKKLEQACVEWIQKYANISAEVYEQALVPKFNPKQGFAAEWAATAKMAGCKYLVFTSKHHEGFALHDSQYTHFDAKDSSGRDLFKEIVDATKAAGLKVGAYHSLIDWHHPHAYAGFGLPTVQGVTNDGRNNAIYVNYLHQQVEEILTRYGTIDVVWWDYSRPDCQGESWRAKDLIAMVRKHQPQIIMNDRLFSAPTGSHKEDHLGTWNPSRGDFTTPEQRIPDSGIAGVDWETCMTMNRTWGYNQYDHDWKPTKVLIRNLIEIVSKGGNYLLNIGPRADGSIPAASMQRMQAIGKWMAINGEAIYGTTASPYEKPDWGRYTAKADRLYAHVFDWPQNSKLSIPTSKRKVAKAYLLADHNERPLKITATPTGTTLHLPTTAPDSSASVIVIKYEDSPIRLP